MAESSSSGPSSKSSAGSRPADGDDPQCRLPSSSPRSNRGDVRSRKSSRQGGPSSPAASRARSSRVGHVSSTSSGLSDARAAFDFDGPAVVARSRSTSRSESDISGNPTLSPIVVPGTAGGGFQVDRLGPTAGMEEPRRQVEPLREQGRDEVVELGQPGSSRQVRGDGEGGPAAQGVLDEPGQVPPGPDVDEQAQAVVVQRLDRPAELDRPRPLVDGQPADRLGVVGHPPGEAAGVERRRRPGDLQRLEERADRPQRRGEVRACDRRERTAGPRRARPQPAAGRRPPRRRRPTRPGRPGAGSCPRRRPPAPASSPSAASTRSRSAATTTRRAVGTCRRRLQLPEQDGQIVETLLQLPIDAHRPGRRQRQELAAAVAGHARRAAARAAAGAGTGPTATTARR